MPVGTLAIGPLREPSLGVSVAGGVALERWRFLAKGTYWLPQHASTTSELQEYGADIDRATAALLACRAVVQGRFELAPCAIVSLEHLWARGTGTHIAAHSPNATWLAAGLGAHGRLHLAAWLSLVLAVDGQIESSSPRLTLGGVGSVERLLPVAASVSLGSEWIF